MPDSTPRATPSQASSGTHSPGNDLRERVEALGGALADRLAVVLEGIPGRPTGPQRLGQVLDQTIVTASRLLKAISQSDPIAVVQLLPGPNPLRKTVETARTTGVSDADCDAALESIAIFDRMIREEAGDRGSLKAMLTAWLPEERREFEAQRRQSIFKARTELGGVSCELEVNTIVLHPSEASGQVDLLNVKCLLGIDRIRPDAVVKLGTRRIVSSAEAARPRIPLNLDGEPLLDGLNRARLDDYCNAPPAPFLIREFGQYVEYTLGPTGFGLGSTVDLVVAELNSGELDNRLPTQDDIPFFLTIPEMPTRKFVFDMLVHEEVYGGASPELLTYETSGMGPARPHDPARELDLRSCVEPLQSLGGGIRRLRILEFARYGGLLEHAFAKVGWEASELRAYRVAVTYPLIGRQLTLAFCGAPDRRS